MTKRSLSRQQLLEKGVTCLSKGKDLSKDQIKLLPDKVEAINGYLNATCPCCNNGSGTLKVK